MKIVIVGAVEIGRHMALSLSQEAHSIVVIEMDEAVAADIDAQIDARVTVVSKTSRRKLLKLVAG